MTTHQTFDEPITPRLYRLLNEPTVFDRPDPWVEFAKRTIPTPPEVYRRRRLVLVLLIAAAVLIAAAIHGGVIRDGALPVNSPDILAPDGTPDGRYHTCGFVTDDGVTEYLDTYTARCGNDPAYAGDPSR